MVSISLTDPGSNSISMKMTVKIDSGVRLTLTWARALRGPSSSLTLNTG